MPFSLSLKVSRRDTKVVGAVDKRDLNTNELKSVEINKTGSPTASLK